MSESSKPRAGGIFIAIGVITGAVIGALLGEPTIGFLAGLGVGLAIMAATTLRR